MKSFWKNFAALALTLSTGVTTVSPSFGQGAASPGGAGSGSGGGGNKGPGAAVPGAAAGGVGGSNISTGTGAGSPGATGGGAGGGAAGARPSASGTGGGGGSIGNPNAVAPASGSGAADGQNPQSAGLETGRTRVAPTPGTSITTGQTGNSPGQSGATTTGGTAAGGASASSGRSPTPGQLFRAKQIVGSQVQLSGNIAAGTVDDFVVDENGYVEYVIVNSNGQFVTVPWDATAFNFEKQTAMINIAPAVFQKMPTYTADRYPVFSEPQYRTTIYRAYGLTPRERTVILPRQ